MFASLCFGFFDADALRHHSLVVRQPLEARLVACLFREHGEILPDGDGCIDGHRFIIHPEGFIETTSVLTSFKVMDFITRLVTETGCEIASAHFGGFLTLDSLRSNFERLAKTFPASEPNEGDYVEKAPSRLSKHSSSG